MPPSKHLGARRAGRVAAVGTMFLFMTKRSPMGRGKGIGPVFTMIAGNVLIRIQNYGWGVNQIMFIYRIMDQHVYVLLISDGRRDMQALLQRRLLEA